MANDAARAGREGALLNSEAPARLLAFGPIWRGVTNIRRTFAQTPCAPQNGSQRVAREWMSSRPSQDRNQVPGSRGSP